MNSVRVIIESVVVLAIVAVANLVFGRNDPGWLNLNPTPYLLVPLLVGGRYGFGSGIIAGVLAALVPLLAHHLSAGGEVGASLRQYAFPLIALPLVGAVSGELHRFLSTKMIKAERDAGELERTSTQLEAALQVSRDAQGQLQEQLALHGAEFVSSDLELQKLFEKDAGPLLPNTLTALSELAGVASAAFYKLEDGEKLILEAQYGDSGSFPDTVPAKEAEIAREAVDQGALITCKSMWKAGADAQGRFIAAVPWIVNGKPSGRVLVIADMPFRDINWPNFGRIEVFCRWVAEMEAAGANGSGGGRMIADSSSLRTLVGVATDSANKTGVPSTVLLISAISSALSMQQLEAAVGPQLGVSQIAGRVEHSAPARLAVVLPMGGRRDAYELAERAHIATDGGVVCSTVIVERNTGMEPLWEAINDVG